MLQILGETLLIISGQTGAKAVRPGQEQDGENPRLAIWRRPDGTPRLG